MDAPEKYQGFGLQLKFATTEGREEREILLYGFVSFVSEFGGSLGLYLGFSFYMALEPLYKGFSLGKQNFDKLINSNYPVVFSKQCLPPKLDHFNGFCKFCFLRI